MVLDINPKEMETGWPLAMKGNNRGSDTTAPGTRVTTLVPGVLFKRDPCYALRDECGSIRNLLKQTCHSGLASESASFLFVIHGFSEGSEGKAKPRSR